MDTHTHTHASYTHLPPGITPPGDPRQHAPHPTRAHLESGHDTWQAAGFRWPRHACTLPHSEIQIRRAALTWGGGGLPRPPPGGRPKVSAGREAEGALLTQCQAGRCA